MTTDYVLKRNCHMRFCSQDKNMFLFSIRKIVRFLLFHLKVKKREGKSDPTVLFVKKTDPHY